MFSKTHSRIHNTFTDLPAIFSQITVEWRENESTG